MRDGADIDQANISTNPGEFMKTDYAKVKKLTSQVNTLGEVIAQMTKEMEMIRQNIALLAKVAHFHGEPEVAEKVKEAFAEANESPNWVKKEFTDVPTQEDSSGTAEPTPAE
jgi:hypothetical protein